MTAEGRGLELGGAGRTPSLAGHSRPGPKAEEGGAKVAIAVLAGGVGAARFLAGLTQVAHRAEITVVGNTGDDFEIHGLHVSPDLDTVAYSIAGLGDWERGWGLLDDTFQAATQLRRLGEETWFQLGDRDLATQIWRTGLLRQGRRLSQVTARMAERLGLPFRLLPMSDQPVTTRVLTSDGRDLHLQEYLVRERCEPEIRALEYRGVERARPAPGVVDAIRSCDLLVLAPSNPLISLGPILALAGLRAEVGAAPRVVAVSPIVQGRAIKGPLVEMLQAVGVEASALGVAQLYSDIATDLVMDGRDRELAPAVERLGVRVHLAETLMSDQASREGLARAVLLATLPEAGS